MAETRIIVLYNHLLCEQVLRVAASRVMICEYGYVAMIFAFNLGLTQLPNGQAKYHPVSMIKSGKRVSE